MTDHAEGNAPDAAPPPNNAGIPYLYTEAACVWNQAERMGIPKDAVVGIVDEHIREVIDVAAGLREEATKARVIALLREQGYTVIPPDTSREPRGWFAAADREQGVGEDVWQPCLQCNGTIQTFDIWFRSEAECLGFIHREILGKGILP